MADSFEYTCSQCRESLTLPLSLMGQQGIRARQCSPGLALSMCICHVVGAIPLIGLGGLVNLVGLIIWFPVVFGLKNCATDIINHKMAIEQQQQG